MYENSTARIMYCVVLALICILICIQLLQASNKLKEQKERDASRIEVIPMTNDGYLIYTNQSNFEGWSRNIDNALEGMFGRIYFDGKKSNSLCDL